jgi:hypothetical protein
MESKAGFGRFSDFSKASFGFHEGSARRFSLNGIRHMPCPQCLKILRQHKNHLLYPPNFERYERDEILSGMQHAVHTLGDRSTHSVPCLDIKRDDE